MLHPLARRLLMYPQADNPWVFGFPLLTVWGVRIRLNPLYLGLWLWLGGRFGLPLGTLAFGLLTVLIVFHEFSHVLAARWTGGDADDIVLWPFGGLALCRRAPTFQSEFLAPAAGPLFHMFVGLLLLPAMLSSEQLGRTLNPIDFPSLDLTKGIPQTALLLLYALNAKLLYLNLLPMLPLDGSSMWQAVARQRWEAVHAKAATLIVSVVTHLALLLVSLNIEPASGIQLLLLTYSLLPVTIIEAVRLQLSQQFGEFSDRDAFDLSDDDDAMPRPVRQPGLLERWRIERERKRLEREEQERIETEVQLDALLEKINQSGIDSLSDAEKKFLKKASARYRDQGKPS